MEARPYRKKVNLSTVLPTDCAARPDHRAYLCVPVPWRAQRTTRSVHTFKHLVEDIVLAFPDCRTPHPAASLGRSGSARHTSTTHICPSTLRESVCFPWRMCVAGQRADNRAKRLSAGRPRLDTWGYARARSLIWLLFLHIKGTCPQQNRSGLGRLSVPTENQPTRGARGFFPCVLTMHYAGMRKKKKKRERDEKDQKRKKGGRRTKGKDEKKKADHLDVGHEKDVTTIRVGNYVSCIRFVAPACGHESVVAAHQLRSPCALAASKWSRRSAKEALEPCIAH